MIHPLIVAAALFYAAAIWFISRRHAVRMDTRLYGHVLAGEGFLYVLFWIVDVPIDARAFFVRLSLIIIALSQAIPLHISYNRSRDRDSQ